MARCDTPNGSRRRAPATDQHRNGGAFRLLAVLVCATAVGSASAQNAPKPAAAPPDPARQIAATVQSFYDQTRDLSASFYQTYVNKVYDRTDRSSGKVTFKKPGRMRMDYAKPNGKIIVAGAGKITVYEPGDAPDEPGQVLEQNFNETDLPQAMAFLMGTSRLAEDFDFKLLDAAREGYPAGQVLELKPRKPNPHFDRLLFYVETAANLRGLVRRLVIVDSTGNRNRFDFSQFKFNSGTPDSTFTWKPPANARRVHL
ncbi:MAG TPA: outer membrane lipoprotein carrier protein LolA [Polyangiales bacterium]|nr:outer membrane lipoprotein carrier protein LolA [Polyangiales bacterium]